MEIFSAIQPMEPANAVAGAELFAAKDSFATVCPIPVNRRNVLGSIARPSLEPAAMSSTEFANVEEPVDFFALLPKCAIQELERAPLR